MAEKPGSKESPVELRREIAQSRELVVRDVAGLRYELNYPLKFRKMFQRHTTLIIGGAVVVGLCVALLRARTQKVYVGVGDRKARSSGNKTLLESGALLSLLKLGMTVVQPMVVSYFAKKGAKRGGEKGTQSRRAW